MTTEFEKGNSVFKDRPWLEKAHCAGKDPLDWDTDKLTGNYTERTQTAHERCQPCPVIQQCGNWTLGEIRKGQMIQGVILAGIAFPDGARYFGEIKHSAEALAAKLNYTTSTTPTRHQPGKPCRECGRATAPAGVLPKPGETIYAARGMCNRCYLADMKQRKKENQAAAARRAKFIQQLLDQKELA